MVLSSRLRITKAALPFAIFQLVLPAVCVSAAPSATQNAAPAKPAPAAAEVPAAISETESKIAGARSMTISSSTGGTLLPGSPIKMRATMERPSSLRLIITRDGKYLGTVVTGPNGGYVYDAAGNRYLKTEKGTNDQDTVRNAFAAADSILPSGTVLGMFATVSFLMKPLPLEIPPSGDFKSHSTDDTVNGTAVTHFTETISHGTTATAFEAYVNKKTGMPVKVSLSGKKDGQDTGSLISDFDSFELGDTQPASTFEYTPPAGATAYVPPAPLPDPDLKAPDNTPAPAAK